MWGKESAQRLRASTVTDLLKRLEQADDEATRRALKHELKKLLNEGTSNKPASKRTDQSDRKGRAEPTRSGKFNLGRPTPVSWRVLTLRLVACIVGTLVACALFGFAFASSSSPAQLAGFVLGILSAGIAATLAIMLAWRLWPLFPMFVSVGLCAVMVSASGLWYLSVNGTRVTTTVAAVHCTHAKKGLACSAQLRRPDGSLIDYDVAMPDQPDVGDTEYVIEDPAGLIAPHLAEDVVDAPISVIRILLWISVGLVTVLYLICGLTGQRLRRAGREPFARAKAKEKARKHS